MPRGRKLSEKQLTHAEMDALDKEHSSLKEEIKTKQTRIEEIQQEMHGFYSARGYIRAIAEGIKKRLGRPKGPGNKGKKFRRGTGKYKPTDEEVAAAIKEHSKLSDKDIAKLLKDTNKFAVRADRIARVRKESKGK